jgi:hypothetical protein
MPTADDDGEPQPDWPLSVEEAVDRLVDALSDEDQATIRAMREGQMRAELHFSLGMYVRNQFGLWRETSLCSLTAPAASVPAQTGASSTPTARAACSSRRCSGGCGRAPDQHSVSWC